ncbi:hypothetical protein XENTR_v10014214 [Xenopus tropicalis]|uniref:E3 ubiquitin-protein ligase E3D n=1 Tax=Xenopus tropicalis TaxID=8364 RepID=F7E020_XENTR|nr:E3 ubiquitin-protein ligase E3D isoform X1 [Xenopus tropicalis]KAE8603095.1 hypothetical protein XENTR_v10014214 [Xenopus tropicalis]|eukprot:XP_002938501.1 PREDICTED: E3 ubiquitin-protein ligase E3D [Xenopus tropicalis]
MEDIVVRLEIRKHMQTASLILGGLDGFPVDVSLGPSYLQIQTSEQCERFCIPAEVKLLPSSCRLVQQIAGEGLHMRLKVEAANDTDMPLLLKEILKTQKSYTFYCQSCGELIIRKQQFCRVLPLPSENWSSLVEEWCCHPDPFANRNCLPKVNDCFLGDTFLLLNKVNISDPLVENNEKSSVPRLADANALKSKENTKVICKRCKAMLGEKVSSDAIKYYITEIMIQPSSQGYNMISRMEFLESILVRLLMEHSICRSSFRFCIQESDGKHFFLLWLLNSDTLLVESPRKPGTVNNSFFSDNNVVSSTRALEAKNAIRVLFLPCSENRNKELADKWMNDTGAHSLTFPLNTCLELILLLSLNNTSLPISLRFMNSWQVAYLKM